MKRCRRFVALFLVLGLIGLGQGHRGLAAAVGGSMQDGAAVLAGWQEPHGREDPASSHVHTQHAVAAACVFCGLPADGAQILRPEASIWAEARAETRSGLTAVPFERPPRLSI